jgi:methionyl aminopeptidase
MVIKTQIEKEKYIKACQLSTEILEKLKDSVKDGVLPIEIDNLAKELCLQNHVKPSFLGVGDPGNKYQYATCISVNDTVVHGIPSKTKPLQKGDIVKVDFGLIKEGFYTDHCFTVGISPVNQENIKLMEVGRKAVWEAAQKAIAGNRVGDISATIQEISSKYGFNVIKEFTGHGIGKTLHEDPQIPSFGTHSTGKLLTEGMVLCIEAQITTGDNRIQYLNDGWTVKLIKENPVVMFEYMVLVQKDKPLILTNTYNWNIVV